MSCVQSITFPDDHSINCSFVSGCVAIGCKVVIECDQLSTVKQEPYELKLMRKNDSPVSESGLLPCDSNAMCTANSFSFYAEYDNGYPDVPDVVLSNIPLPVCSTSTCEFLVVHVTLLQKWI